MYKNTVNKIEEIEPEKLNKLLKTDYAEEKKNKQTNKTKTKTVTPNVSHDSYTCQALK